MSTKTAYRTAKDLNLPTAKDLNLPTAKCLNLPTAKCLNLPTEKDLNLPTAKGLNLPTDLKIIITRLFQKPLRSLKAIINLPTFPFPTEKLEKYQPIIVDPNYNYIPAALLRKR